MTNSTEAGPDGVGPREAIGRIVGEIADLEGEHEVMVGREIDPEDWSIDVRVSDLKLILSAIPNTRAPQPSPAAVFTDDQIAIGAKQMRAALDDDGWDDETIFTTAIEAMGAVAKPSPAAVEVERLREAAKSFVAAIDVNDHDTLSRLRPDNAIVWRATGSWSVPAAVTIGDFRRLREALSALSLPAAVDEGWRSDMESAPRDDTEFLAGWPGRKQMCIVYARPDGTLVEVDDNAGWMPGYQPTHWRPLPAPPLSTLGTGEGE